MHSYTGSSGTIFNFNSDFSGDVWVKSGGKTIWFPANDILELVAFNYVSRNKIARIEDMDYKELLDSKE